MAMRKELLLAAMMLALVVAAPGGALAACEVGQLTVCMPATTVGYEPYSLTRHSLYALTLETKYRNITV
jgi:uncharacterized membrane protein YoaK (UPF0700 family)